MCPQAPWFEANYSVGDVSRAHVCKKECKSGTSIDNEADRASGSSNYAREFIYSAYFHCTFSDTVKNTTQRRLIFTLL